MKKSIKLHDDPKFAGVLTDINQIETRLIENGKLFELTGNKASSVTITFEMYGEGKKAEPSILIKVTTPDDCYVDTKDAVLEDFEDFVILELEKASIEWSQEVKTALGDDRQVILLINENEV